MDIEFETYLVNNYGHLFDRIKTYDGKPYYGCSCRNGWFMIIRQMCDTIHAHIKRVKESAGEVIPFKIVQIKEKFGHLRVYFNDGDTFISGVVRMAEAMSAYTCEETGGPGVLHRTKTGWLRTLSPQAALNCGATMFKFYPKRQVHAISDTEVTMPELTDDWGVISSRKIGDYMLKCTCSACPEQYDVFVNGDQIGYLRLRHGVFRADYPDVGGHTVYTTNTVGDGCFDNAAEREKELTAAINALAAHRKTLGF